LTPVTVTNGGFVVKSGGRVVQLTNADHKMDTNLAIDQPKLVSSSSSARVYVLPSNGSVASAGSRQQFYLDFDKRSGFESGVGEDAGTIEAEVCSLDSHGSDGDQDQSKAGASLKSKKNSQVKSNNQQANIAKNKKRSEKLEADILSGKLHYSHFFRERNQQGDKYSLPADVTKQLILDISSFGGLGSVHLKQLCDFKSSQYGEKGSTLRRSIQRKVYKWKQGKKDSLLEYIAKRLKRDANDPDNTRLTTTVTNTVVDKPHLPTEPPKVPLCHPPTKITSSLPLSVATAKVPATANMSLSVINTRPIPENTGES
jgi:hypothetical protein